VSLRNRRPSFNLRERGGGGKSKNCPGVESHARGKCAGGRRKWGEMGGGYDDRMRKGGSVRALR